MAIENTNEPEIEAYDGPEMELERVLRRTSNSDLLELWNKSLKRLSEDPNGAITSAKTFVEQVCKKIAHTADHPIDGTEDLPKLFGLALTALVLDSDNKQVQADKAVARSLFSIINTVATKRNVYGDAHARLQPDIDSSLRTQAELVVALATAVSLYLLRHLDIFVYQKHRLNEIGLPSLKFDKTTVWRLVDHARNMKKHWRYLDEEPAPSLMLVGDSGIYLMSNGVPKLGDSGLLVEGKSDKAAHSLVVHAEGCNPGADEFEHWWQLHGLVAEGSDFCYPIEVEYFLKPLQECRSHIVISFREEVLEIESDMEFEKTQF